MPEPVANPLGQFDQNESNALFGVYKKWREAGADQSGAPLDADSNKRLMDYKDATEGYTDPNTRQFVPPWMDKIPGIDLKAPLEIKPIPDVTLQIKEQQDQLLDNRIKKQQQIKEKAAIEDPSFLSKLGSGTLDVIKELPAAATGFSMGVAEAVNPLSLPHAAEQIYRAFGEEADPNKGFFERIAERMQKAEEKTVTPRLDLTQLAAGARTGAMALGDLALGNPDTLMNLGKTYEGEMQSQKAFQESGNLPAYKTTGELTVAIPALYQVGKGFVKGGAAAADYVGKLKPGTVKEILTMKKLREAIKSIGKQAASDANLAETSKTPLKQAQEMYAEMLGDTAGEIGDAIYKRTEKVEDLVKGSPEARSLFPEVQKLREHVDGTEQLVGEAVGEFRDFILNQKDIRVNTQGLVNKLGAVRNRLTLETGASATESKDLQTIAKYQFLLNAPKKVKEMFKEVLLETGDFDEILVQLTPKERTSFINELTKDIPIDATKNTKDISVSDALRISDSLDTTISRLKNATGNASREVLETLIDIRNDIKGLLHKKFPAYSKADELYTAYKQTSENIRRKIDSEGAEAFLSRLYGQDKTEQRQLLEQLINQGRDASKAIKEMGKEAKFGSRAVNKEASALVTEIKAKAADLEFPEAQQFFNDIADKVAARGLAKYKSSGQADFPADKVRSMQDRFIARAKEIGQARGRLAGGVVGAVTGGVSGTLLGLLVAKSGTPLQQAGTALGMGSFGATYLGDKFGKATGFLTKALAGSLAEKEAKNLFTPQHLLNLLKKAKNTSPELRSYLSDVTFIEREFGAEEAIRYLGIIPVSPKLASAVEKMSFVGAKGLAGAVEENNLGPFGQYLDFTEGSTVTPKKKEKK